VQLETVSISHPSFSQTYYLVRNHSDGVTVKYENGSSIRHEYLPMAITSLGNRGDLDHGFSVSLGDVDSVAVHELELVAQAGTFNQKPKFIYRTYRSDDLEHILFGPIVLEISNFTLTKDGVAFEATAPKMNINRTGELYSLDRFPMLRGFL
jgi:hypothetical protein